MKNKRGAAEVVVRSDDGEELVESEIKEVVGSSWFWRWRRFDSMIKNDSSIFGGFLKP